MPIFFSASPERLRDGDETRSPQQGREALPWGRAAAPPLGGVGDFMTETTERTSPKINSVTPEIYKKMPVTYKSHQLSLRRPMATPAPE